MQKVPIPPEAEVFLPDPPLGAIRVGGVWYARERDLGPDPGCGECELYAPGPRLPGSRCFLTSKRYVIPGVGEVVSECVSSWTHFVSTSSQIDLF